MWLRVGGFYITFGTEGIRRILDAPWGRNRWTFVIYTLSEGNAEDTGYSRRAAMIFAASCL